MTCDKQIVVNSEEYKKSMKQRVWSSLLRYCAEFKICQLNDMFEVRMKLIFFSFEK